MEDVTNPWDPDSGSSGASAVINQPTAIDLSNGSSDPSGGGNDYCKDPLIKVASALLSAKLDKYKQVSVSDAQQYESFHEDVKSFLGMTFSDNVSCCGEFVAFAISRPDDSKVIQEHIEFHYAYAFDKFFQGNSQANSWDLLTGIKLLPPSECINA